MRGYLILIIVNWLELKTANDNNIPLTELTSEVGADDNKITNINDIEEVQKSILDGLHSVLSILCNDVNKPQNGQ